MGITTIQEIARHLRREVETENPPDRVMARLHHVVLPKLADANIVDYDREANTVQYIGHPFVEACLNLFQNT